MINKKDTIASQDVDEESNLSCFYLTLEKFNILNNTLDYSELKKNLGHLVSVKTLPQIIHDKNKIFAIIIEQLKKPDNQALDVIIELISSLAKDIQADFYPYFEEIFLSLIKFLSIQNVPIIESIFHCFAHLFKILWKFMIKDLKKIFHLFSKHFFNYDQKDYIRTFASQSFAFLIRKTLNHDGIISFLFKEVEANQNIVSGVASLLFETVKGVKTRFHSCFDSFVASLLRQYTQEWKDRVGIKECVHETFQLMIEHTDNQNSKVIWICLLDTVKDNCKCSSKLKPVIELILKMVEYKNCRLVDDCNHLINVINNLLSQTSKNDECLPILFQICTHLLVNLNQDKSKEVNCALMENCFRDSIDYKMFFKFAQSLFTYIFFERDVLKRLLLQCQKYLTTTDHSSQSFSDSLLILYELISCKRPLTLPPQSFSWNIYVLNFDQFLSTTSIILSLLKNHSDWETVLKAVKILPHIRPLDIQKCGLALINLYNIVFSRLSSSHETEPRDIELLETVLLEVIHSLILLDFAPMFDHINLSSFLDILETSSTNQKVLQTLVYYFQYARKLDKKHIFDIYLFEKVYFNHLQNNLLHFNTKIRLLTLLLIDLFDPPLPPNEDGSTAQSIFSICLNIEMIPPTLQDYREKLRLLNLLDYGLISYSIPIATLSNHSYQYAALSFLLGSLYINLSLLWVPIQKIIESHVRGIKDFSKSWQIIKQHFNQTKELINSRVNDNVFSLAIDHNTNRLSLNYDHFNHRILLLNTFKLISDIIEPRNADLVSWFLTFIDQETGSINISRSKATEDITLTEELDDRQEEEIEKNEEDKEDKDDDDDDKDDEEEDNDKDRSKLSEKRKGIWKTLLAFLDLFASFRNPKAFYKEKQLQDLYHLLLTMKNSQVQKSALKCILTYNHKYLTPYCNNLFRIIDDSTFKSETVLFNLAEDGPEENRIDPDLRPHLMLYLMRILYGKMLSKTGSQTAGKSKANLRRSIVFRFLAACSESELMLFVELAFSSFINYLKMDYQQIEEEFNQMDLKNVIPLKHVKSCLSTLEVMMIHLGNIATNLLPFFFKLLLTLSFYVTTLVSKRLSIKKVFISRLKTLRTECFRMVNLFFATFTYYSFSAQEINMLFKSFVIQMLINLENSSLESPSPVLKLFLTFSEHSRYFVIFVKKIMLKGQLESTSPISCIINLYSNDKADASVFKCISRILSNLLSFDNYQPMDTESEHISGPLLDIEDLVDVRYYDNYLSLEGSLNFGTIILEPFLSKILSRLKKTFEKRITQRRSKSKLSIITNEESIILSHISELMEEETDCVILAHLLLDSIDVHLQLSEESIVKTLKSVNNLIKRVKNSPKQYLNKLSRFLSQLTDRSARLEIIEIIETIAANDFACLEISQLIKLINSYNPRNPEEPDFNVRDQGFRMCKQKILNMKFDTDIDSELLYLIIHNCCFFIRNIDDLGLREASSETLRLIVEQLSQNKDKILFKKICFDLLYNGEVIKGLKHSNENVKHEFIVILDNLIKYGKAKHSFFDQLSILCNEEEPDLDFWLNIRHIQVHRRVRALNRLARNYVALSKISAQILNHCLLSIASGFLFDKKYGKYPTAVTAAIDLIGSICLFLNWPMYETLLKQQLKLLSEDRDNHKTIVRTISTILGNFNFDLSNSESADKDANLEKLKSAEVTLVEPQILDKEMATKIHLSIVENLLPQLHESLHRLAYADHDHDSIRVEYQQEDEIKRIPIAIAIVKLLLNIPILPSVFEINLRSVFLRLCHFLKSRVESIREVARSTLIKIMQSLGAKHLRSLLLELQSSLRKGYQLHVLTYSIHVILENMVSVLKSGDLDNCAKLLIDIANQELFTDIAEEKEIGKIVAKSKEAKKVKSYEIYRLIGKFISEDMLIECVIPIKDIIIKAIEPKVLKKSSLCLQKLFNGVADNEELSTVCLLTFILDVLEDKIPELSVKKVKKLKKIKALRKDYRLLEPEPKIKTKQKTNPATNVYILFEYSFKLLLSLFKKERISLDCDQTKDLLNKFIPLFKDALTAKHPKLTTTALRSINYIIIKFKSLPTFIDYCNQIKDNILILLHECTGQKFASGDNFELLSACFKTISFLICEVEEIKIDEEQLRILLLYIDQDIDDRFKQLNAFVLLKSILSKKLTSPELSEIMKKIANLIIQSDEDFIRNEGRQVWIKYLFEYPHEKQFEGHVMFFLRQLLHERISGRESALKFIESIINHLSSNHLETMGSNIFIHISARLINDESSKCRNLSTSILKLLITRSSTDLKNLFFKDIVLSWFQEDNSLQRQLAAQLCVIFAEAESSKFKSRFRYYLPLLEQQLDFDRYPKRDYNSEPTSDDFLIDQLLKLFNKSLEVDPTLINDKKWSQYINSVLFYIEKFYLSHCNIWIRLRSLKIITLLFSHYSSDDLVKAIIYPRENNEYLLHHCPHRIWSLCKQHLVLFNSLYEVNEIGDYLVQNLLSIGRVLCQLPKDIFLVNKSQPESTLQNRFKIDWFIRRLIREVNREIVKHSNRYEVRIVVFKWIMVMVVEMDVEQVKSNLKPILLPLCREVANKGVADVMHVSEDNLKSKLVTLGFHLFELIRDKVESETFTKVYAQVLSFLNRKRSDRKALKAIEVNDDYD